jgi:predicted metal-dependent HD superfamily phosphohydrolase
VDLAERFAAAVTSAGGQPIPSVTADLLAGWSQPHRHYHNLDHLTAVLDIADAHARFADDITAVRLALFTHDAIYDPRAADNEEASALLSAQLLARCSVPAPTIAEIQRLVRLTAGHAVSPEDGNGALLADADLAVLARPWPAYAAYADAIRAEYAHVPDDLFRAGRARVLSGLLALPTLYRIPALRERWEEPARANVARELTNLTATA